MNENIEITVNNDKCKCIHKSSQDHCGIGYFGDVASILSDYFGNWMGLDYGLD